MPLGTASTAVADDAIPTCRTDLLVQPVLLGPYFFVDLILDTRIPEMVLQTIPRAEVELRVHSLPDEPVGHPDVFLGNRQCAVVAHYLPSFCRYLRH